MNNIHSFGMVHSERAVAVLLHNASVPDLLHSVILSALSCNVHKQLWANLTSQHMSTIHSVFLSWLMTSNFSSIPIFLHQFFTWMALSYVDLCFPLILIIKANAVEGGTTPAMWYHLCNHSIHVTNGMTVISPSASLQHKTRVAIDRVCQTALN